MESLFTKWWSWKLSFMCYGLWIVAIKSNVANPLALESELTGGLTTAVNSDYHWLNLHSLSTGKLISKMIYRRLEIFCFATWDTKINDLYVLANCLCSQDVLFQVQITNQLHLKGKDNIFTPNGFVPSITFRFFITIALVKSAEVYQQFIKICQLRSAL